MKNGEMLELMVQFVEGGSGSYIRGETYNFGDSNDLEQVTERMFVCAHVRLDV